MDDLLNTAPCGFLSSTDDGTIVVANATLLDILEYPLEELQGKPVKSIMPVASQVFCQTHIFPLLKMHGRVDELYLSLWTKSRHEVPVLVNVMTWRYEGQLFNNWVFMPMRRRSEYEDQLIRLKKQAEEAQKALEAKQTELVEVNARLEILTVTDSLTGLKNRHAFEESLGSHIALADRMSAALSLLLIDVDHFKSINDTFGHPVGDKYLIDVAGVLGKNSRKGDFVCRYGGEEFAVILPDADHSSALKVAEKFREAVESASWEQRAITVSIGISTLSPGEIGDATLLVSMADQALYLSKQRGRNRVTHAADLKSLSD
jgi:diguanylate cyclase (GGDEF)-like protein